MKNKYVFVAVMLLGILFIGMGLTSLYVGKSAQQEEGEGEFTVVTSFYPMYIAASNVVGTVDVQLCNLSEPQTGCLHDFQLTPEDMKLLSRADVFIINGGGIESFIEEVAAAYPELTILEACENTELLVEDGEENAHAWMSVAAYETQVQTIADGLAEADAKNAAAYQQNAQAYLEKLEPLRERQQTVAKNAAGQSVILFQEAYAYVADDYGLTVRFLLDLDEERQVSAGEVEAVLSAIRDGGVACILAEELYGRSMAETVQKEMDVTVLYLDPLNRGDYDRDSYLDGMSRNIDLLEQAFGGQSDE
jgi:zinc transport system substrate-binding protein